MKQKAFTIIEVLMVVMLIALLAAFMIPRYLDRAEAAKRSAARTQIALIEQHLSAFYMDSGRYPTQTEGFAALRTAPPGLSAEKWKGPYAKEADLKDPWGMSYQYVNPGKKNPGKFDIYSFGPDGQPGGDGVNADIYYD